MWLLSRVQVSGLMLANHTSIRHLFSRCASQYEKLRRKNAFLDQYRQFATFKVSGRLVVLCESPTVTWLLPGCSLRMC